ncbi:TRAP transporter small permease [Thauera sp.]|uniref:TRAP transporter small permease n=1 Tax=Thauera sp. TaxID=1905334 RepID=UPI002C2246A8|nr:TRAP transporter small permease [Thauera sp.]HRP23464.1 TRAP transporter small permease [Thauera sp.]
MRTIGHCLQHLIELLMALMLSVMVIAVFMNVVLRYTAGTGFASSEELARLLFVWLVCLGAILASAENRHLGFDLVQSRLPWRARQACTWITRVLVLYPILLLIQGAYEQVKVGVGIYSPVMGYPLALTAAAVLVMAAAMLGLLAVNTLRGLREQADDNAGEDRQA